MITVIAFIVILGILVLMHEWGHFISARRLGVEVEEFGLGFPPRVFSWKRKGILYSINLIPIGGFVKIRGEDGRDDDPHSFASQATWKKSLIVSAGVLMNILLAIVLLSVSFYIGIPQILDKDYDLSKVSQHSVIIAQVLDSGPAQQAGLEINDKVLTIDGEPIKSARQVYQKVEESKDRDITLGVERNREIKDYTLRPQIITPDRPPLLGIAVSDIGVIDYNLGQSIGQGVKNTFIMVGLIFQALYNLVTNLIRTGQLDAGLAGPVGVAVITGQIVKLGFLHTLQFMAILSINLAVLNILPIPALDGGRLLFILLEKIRGRKLNVRVEGWIHNSGFVLLILLIIFITFRDIGRYGGQIWESLKNLF